MTRHLPALAAAWVVARRDFLATVATPTFLLFLLAPLFLIGLSVAGGVSASGLGDTVQSQQRIVAVVPAAQQAAFAATDARLRTLLSGRSPPELLVFAQGPTRAASQDHPDVVAVLRGSADAPVIRARDPGGPEARYLALLAETVARAGTDNSLQSRASTARVEPMGQSSAPSSMAQAGLAYGVVFVLFLLILMLGGQSVGTLAEEKGNKVIEILAAAVPLESVFFGKLVGLLGVALLFVAFWGSLLLGGGLLALNQLGGAELLQASVPAIGWPLFLLFALLYFFMGFLLMGSIFLGLGGLASSVREIQLLSLPITLFQVGMFSLSSAAANSPGTTLAMVAQWLPWSSPLAMAARGATDAAILPHLGALAWQSLWLAVTIWLGVRLFRAGVLRSGPLLKWRKAPVAAVTAE